MRRLGLTPGSPAQRSLLATVRAIADATALPGPGDFETAFAPGRAHVRRASSQNLWALYRREPRTERSQACLRVGIVSFEPANALLLSRDSAHERRLLRRHAGDDATISRDSHANADVASPERTETWFQLGRSPLGAEATCAMSLATPSNKAASAAAAAGGASMRSPPSAVRSVLTAEKRLPMSPVAGHSAGGGRRDADSAGNGAASGTSGELSGVSSGSASGAASSVLDTAAVAARSGASGTSFSTSERNDALPVSKQTSSVVPSNRPVKSAFLDATSSRCATRCRSRRPGCRRRWAAPDRADRYARSAARARPGSRAAPG